MGTHPIFESDFDCLTDLTRRKQTMGNLSSQQKLDQDLYTAVVGYTNEDGILIEGGNLEKIEKLLEQGAQLSVADKGQSAIHEAAARNLDSVLEAIIKHHPDAINAKRIGKGKMSKKMGPTPLKSALMGGHKSTIELLIKKGASNPFADLVESHANSDLYDFTFSVFEKEHGKEKLIASVKNDSKKLSDNKRENIPKDKLTLIADWTRK